VEVPVETAEAVAEDEAAPRLAGDCGSDEGGRLVRREAEEDLLDELHHVLDILPWRRWHGMFSRVGLGGGRAELMGRGGCCQVSSLLMEKKFEW
jgi:hypothetical protein